jgi:hypothetical protein
MFGARAGGVTGTSAVTSDTSVSDGGDIVAVGWVNVVGSASVSALSSFLCLAFSRRSFFSSSVRTQSSFIPIRAHFCSLQNWQLLLVSGVISHCFRCEQKYEAFELTLRRKNALQL